jgi:hypothetical protein
MENRRMGATEVDWREEGDFDYCIQPIVELLVNRQEKQVNGMNDLSASVMLVADVFPHPGVELVVTFVLCTWSCSLFMASCQALSIAVAIPLMCC